ncbi:hypothetical protein GCM10027601_38780 [Nocardioides ungokensis]
MHGMCLSAAGRLRAAFAASSRARLPAQRVVPRTGVLSGHGAIQAFPQRVPPMSDKSPRKVMSRKSGTSITESRAAKRSLETEGSLSDKIHPTSKR